MIMKTAFILVQQNCIKEILILSDFGVFNIAMVWSFRPNNFCGIHKNHDTSYGL